MWDPNRFTADTKPRTHQRLPLWLRRPLPTVSPLATAEVVHGKRLATVCEEAKCPNLPECWSKKTATFLAMGSACTRSCGFCEIDFSKAPPPPDPQEPEKIAQSVRELGLRHVVVTMVARDDLADGGASHIAAIIRAIRHANREATVEVLTSDFQGDPEAIQTVLAAEPEIMNHNIETVARLSPTVRHKATYERTLAFLRIARHAAPSKILLKSGMMVGLGETDDEVYETIDDLREVGCHIITIGQYLQPSRKKLRVRRFVSPDEFATYKTYGEQSGVPYMYCGPYVRSSYNAAEVFARITDDRNTPR